MGSGLQVFAPNGEKTFDSSEAYGGVCLGGFSVPAQSTPYIIEFPEFTSGTPFVFNPLGGSGVIENMFMSYDYALGYLRVIFSPNSLNIPRFAYIFVM